MKLIVGLGNPGTKYRGTRHNIGYGVIEELSDRWDIPMKNREFRGLTGKGVFAGEKVILLKPETFMNSSGECVGPLSKYYGISPEDIIVVFDEIALEPGHIRVRASGSAGGHNGMKSLIAHLGTEKFPRVRIGVGAKPEGADLANWVLSRFPKALEDDARSGLENGARAVEVIIRENIDTAMNLFNGI
ncbi:MAG: aminoacyl-tRNA hydrolase [Lachnospiraceae bacterium]|nr:aminoacyl-tRNA hydrolase [Lachnospiraceae bacterium]